MNKKIYITVFIGIDRQIGLLTSVNLPDILEIYYKRLLNWFTIQDYIFH